MAELPPFGIVPDPDGLAPGPQDAPGNANQGVLNMGELEPGFARSGPLISAEELVEDYLFGIPLQSALTGDVMKVTSITRQIYKAVGDAESSLRIPISPVRVVDKFDYIRSDDTFGFGVKKLTRWPLLQVEALRACFPGYNTNDTSTYTDFPTSWLVPNGDTGLVRIVPISGSVVTSNVNFVSNVGAWVTYFSNLPSWPNMWNIQYTAGFDHDRIPEVVNDFIATLAALRILSMMGPLIFPANSWAVGQNGMSQSTATQGPAFLSQRVAELTADRDRLLMQLKAHYSSGILFSTV